jgi:hypothetical protein
MQPSRLGRAGEKASAFSESILFENPMTLGDAIFAADRAMPMSVHIYYIVGQ